MGAGEFPGKNRTTSHSSSWTSGRDEVEEEEELASCLLLGEGPRLARREASFPLLLLPFGSEFDGVDDDDDSVDDDCDAMVVEKGRDQWVQALRSADPAPVLLSRLWELARNNSILDAGEGIGRGGNEKGKEKRR